MLPVNASCPCLLALGCILGISFILLLMLAEELPPVFADPFGPALSFLNSPVSDFALKLSCFMAFFFNTSSLAGLFCFFAIRIISLFSCTRRLVYFLRLRIHDLVCLGIRRISVNKRDHYVIKKNESAT